jgi:hypothetical protein
MNQKSLRTLFIEEACIRTLGGIVWKLKVKNCLNPAAWLHGQRRSRIPDMHTWFVFMDVSKISVAALAKKEELFDCCDEREKGLHDTLYGPESLLGPLLDLVPAYAGYRSITAKVYSSDRNRMWFVTFDAGLTGGSGPITAREPSGLHVLDALLGTWQAGGPKSRLARRKLCDLVAEYLRTVRTAAVAEYDGALAAATDGSEVLYPEYFASVDRMTLRLYRAHALFEGLAEGTKVLYARSIDVSGECGSLASMLERGIRLVRQNTRVAAVEQNGDSFKRVVLYGGHGMQRVLLGYRLEDGFALPPEPLFEIDLSCLSG